MLCRSLTLVLVGYLPAWILAAGLEDSEMYLRAKNALADGLPEVAAVKAGRLLQNMAWTDAEVKTLATFAAESWVRSGKPAQALALADSYDLEQESFWRAQALALDHKLAEAREELTAGSTNLQPRARLLLGQILFSMGENEAAYQEVNSLLSESDEALRRHAILLMAEIELTNGRAGSALQRLDLLHDPTDVTVGLIRARCLMSINDLSQARSTLERVMALSNGGAGAQDAASISLAEVWLREGQPQKALEHLIKMLDMSVHSDWWEQAFVLLHRTWSALPEPRDMPKAVLRWAGQGSQGQQVPQPSELHLDVISEFRGHAELIIAQWLHASKRPLEAAGLLEGFIRLHPAHPRLSNALQMAMQIYSDLGVEVRVMQLVEQWRSSFSGEQGCTLVDFLAGGIQFRHAEFLAAEESFQAAANVATSLPERRRSLFNAAVSALKGGELVLYLGLLAQLEAAGGNQDSSGDAAADLHLNKALEAASRQSDDADEELRHFISTRPSHPRVNEARMALVQLLLMSNPPLIDEAKRQFSEIRLPDGNSTARDKIGQLMAHTRLWMREISGDSKGLIAECEAFAKAWPQSPLLSEVLMKEAGAHFQLEDFASARTSFEIVAKEHAHSPHADTALYFAALSAMSVMSAEGRERALEIWGGLAKKKGPLAMASLRQQALAYRRQADLPSALKALDQILSMGALDEDKKNLTICEKAEVLLLQGKKDHSRLEEAAKLLRRFLDQGSKLSFLWKARAGFTLATILHEANNDTEALEACYDTLRAADIEPPSNATDYLWFSKAGFFGIELLEDAHQWEAAAKLAEQIAQVKGGRADDARQIATKIRLEHFLWDGPKPMPPAQPNFPSSPVLEKPDMIQNAEPKKKK